MVPEINQNDIPCGNKQQGGDVMALTRKQREKLRMKFGGRCAYCGCELPEKGWHADHVQAVLRKSEQCMKAADIFAGDVQKTGVPAG